MNPRVPLLDKAYREFMPVSLALYDKMKFKIGDTYHILRGSTKPYKIHVIAMFESDGNRIIAIKWYGRHKQWWHYEIKEDYLLESEIEGYKAHNKTIHSDMNRSRSKRTL